MRGIDDFFATRERINDAIINENYKIIKDNFVYWIYRQCINYSGMSKEERRLSKDIPALDVNLKMEFFWPTDFTVSKDYKGVISVVTHELTRTGGPLVLLDAVKIMRKAGYFVLLFSHEDGIIKEEFLHIGVPVIVGEYLKWLDKVDENEECLRFSEIFKALVTSTNILFCNTVVTYQVVKIFNGSELPVFWWIHEGSMVLDQVENCLPKRLENNISLFFVSKYSQNAFDKRNIIYENTNVLSYGINDIGIQSNFVNDGKSIFLIVGTISKRKAQDVLVHAIERIKPSVLEECRFIFIGKIIDSDIFEEVINATRNMSCVEYLEELNHEEVIDMMRSAECVICPSREDSIPVVVTEALALGKIVVCSDHTGTAELIENGYNGFVFKNEDIKGLAELIYKVHSLDVKEKISIGKNARMIFEQNFTISVFVKKILLNIKNLMLNKESELIYYENNIEDFVEYQYERLLLLNDMYLNLKDNMRKQGDASYRDSIYLHSKINNLEKEKGILEEEKNVLEKEKGILEEEKNVLEKRGCELKQKIQVLDEQLSSAYNSMSWKITRPIRKIASLVKK